MGGPRRAGFFPWQLALWRGPNYGSRETFSFFLGLHPAWSSFLLSSVHPSDLEAGEMASRAPGCSVRRCPTHCTCVSKSTCVPPPPPLKVGSSGCGPSPPLVNSEARREPQTPETENQCVWDEGTDCVGQGRGGSVEGELAGSTPTCSTQCKEASCLPPS